MVRVRLVKSSYSAYFYLEYLQPVMVILSILKKLRYFFSKRKSQNNTVFLKMNLAH